MESQAESTETPSPPARIPTWKVWVPAGIVLVGLLIAASWGAGTINARVRLMAKVEAGQGVVHAQDRVWPWVKSVVSPQTSAAMRRISVLDTGQARLDASDVHAIAGMSHLRILTAADVTDETLAAWSDLDELGGLHVGGPGITDTGIGHILQIRSLKYLTLSHTSITDAGLARLAAHAGLRMVRITHAEGITDDGVAHLARLPELLEVAVSNCPVTDASLGHLARAPQLTSLTVEHAPITDAALAHLSRARALVYLNLCGTRITDAAVPVLGAMRNLQSVGVEDTLISEAGRRELALLRGERDLDYARTPFTLEEFLNLGQTRRRQGAPEAAFE
jgi:hypothetical protein